MCERDERERIVFNFYALCGGIRKVFHIFFDLRSTAFVGIAVPSSLTFSLSLFSSSLLLSHLIPPAASSSPPQMGSRSHPAARVAHMVLGRCASRASATLLCARAKNGSAIAIRRGVDGVENSVCFLAFFHLLRLSLFYISSHFSCLL